MSVRGQHHWLIVLLLLALVVLPWRSVYAQSEMLSLPASDVHQRCHQIEQTMQQDNADHAMDCCDQDRAQSQCNQTCSDCYHCSSMLAVISLFPLTISDYGSPYFQPVRENLTGPPLSGQFRPPRLII